MKNTSYFHRPSTLTTTSFPRKNPWERGCLDQLSGNDQATQMSSDGNPKKVPGFSIFAYFHYFTTNQNQIDHETLESCSFCQACAKSTKERKKERIAFQDKGGEKISVAGRPNAGKSSFVAALLRMPDAIEEARRCVSCSWPKSGSFWR